jgi:hypothetical protein
MTDLPRRAALEGFVAFSEGVLYLARSRPAHEARRVLIKAIHERKIAAVYPGPDGQFIELSGALLSQPMDLGSGDLYLPAESAPTSKVYVIDETALDPVGTGRPGPPSSRPEPRPDIAEPSYPTEVLAQGMTIAQRQATVAHYERRKREFDSAISAWREREEARQAAWDAYCLRREAQDATDAARHRQHREPHPRQAAPPAPGIPVPVFVSAEDVRRFAEPAAVQPPPAPTSAQRDGGGPKKGRPYEYDVAEIKNEIRRLVVHDGKLPAVQQILVRRVHEQLCLALEHPPAEVSVRRWISEIWQELVELTKQSAWGREHKT